MKFVLLLLVVFAAPLVYGSKYESCDGGKYFHATNVDVTPQPAKGGQKLTVTVNGQSTTSAKSGKFKYLVELYSTFWFSKGWKKVDEGDDDLCKYTTCPVNPGPVTVKYETTLPKIAPPGDYRVTVKVEDPSGRQVICITVYMTVGSSSTWEALRDTASRKVGEIVKPFPMVEV